MMAKKHPQPAPRYPAPAELPQLIARRNQLAERAALIGKQMFEEQILSAEEQQRVDAIGDQILAEPHLWDDLVPPNPPQEVAPDGAPPPAHARPGRNDPCWCGSGRKYKHCHLRADAESRL